MLHMLLAEYLMKGRSCFPCLLHSPKWFPLIFHIFHVPLIIIILTCPSRAPALYYHCLRSPPRPSRHNSKPSSAAAGVSQPCQSEILRRLPGSFLPIHYLSSLRLNQILIKSSPLMDLFLSAASALFSLVRAITLFVQIIYKRKKEKKRKDAWGKIDNATAEWLCLSNSPFGSVLFWSSWSEFCCDKVIFNFFFCTIGWILIQIHLLKVALYLNT